MIWLYEGKNQFVQCIWNIKKKKKSTWSARHVSMKTCWQVSVLSKSISCKTRAKANITAVAFFLLLKPFFSIPSSLTHHMVEENATQMQKSTQLLQAARWQYNVYSSVLASQLGSLWSHCFGSLVQSSIQFAEKNCLAASCVVPLCVCLGAKHKWVGFCWPRKLHNCPVHKCSMKIPVQHRRWERGRLKQTNK